MEKVERKKCQYPWSLFYIYEDEIPQGTTLSTPEDCAECDCADDCDTGWCLFGGH